MIVGDAFGLSGRWRRAVLLGLVATVMVLIFPLGVVCCAKAADEPDPGQQAVVQRIETYFDRLSTLQGRFVTGRVFSESMATQKALEAVLDWGFECA